MPLLLYGFHELCDKLRGMERSAVVNALGKVHAHAAGALYVAFAVRVANAHRLALAVRVPHKRSYEPLGHGVALKALAAYFDSLYRLDIERRCGEEAVAPVVRYNVHADF